jgi:hypothetical protein
MKNKLVVFVAFIFIICKTFAQWSVQPGIGVANPITGYKTIVKSGRLFQGLGANA